MTEVPGGPLVEKLFEEVFPQSVKTRIYNSIEDTEIRVEQLLHWADMELQHVRFWRNQIFHVELWPSGQTTEAENPPMRLMVERLDHGEYYTWSCMQAIKNAILGSEWEAIELFPSEERLVNVRPQRHLWCWRTLPIEVGWFCERLVRTY